MRKAQYDAKTQDQITKLLNQLEQHDVIQTYRRLEEKIEHHQGLNQMVEEIKNLQKQLVQYDHYDKPNAKAMALKELEEKELEFDTHPLVIAYRDSLIDANELLQHLTKLIQTQFNDQLETKRSTHKE